MMQMRDKTVKEEEEEEGRETGKYHREEGR